MAHQGDPHGGGGPGRTVLEGPPPIGAPPGYGAQAPQPWGAAGNRPTDPPPPPPGMSTGAKVGLIVGLGAGLIAVAAILVLFVVLRDDGKADGRGDAVDDPAALQIALAEAMQQPIAAPTPAEPPGRPILGESTESARMDAETWYPPSASRPYAIVASSKRKARSDGYALCAADVGRLKAAGFDEARVYDGEADFDWTRNPVWVVIPAAFASPAEAGGALARVRSLSVDFRDANVRNVYEKR